MTRVIFSQSLNANAAVGHALNNPSVSISFPEDNSKASQLARINAASVTLQNLNGAGKGCPVASTTFQAQAAAINAGNAPSPSPVTASSAASLPARSPSAAPVAASSGAPSAAQIDALAPQLGFTAGKNPTGKSQTIHKCIFTHIMMLSFSGTGDCDGAVNGANGQPIKVPCSCPPDQATFNQVRDLSVYKYSWEMILIDFLNGPASRRGRARGPRGE